MSMFMMNCPEPSRAQPTWREEIDEGRSASDTLDWLPEGHFYRGAEISVSGWVRGVMHCANNTYWDPGYRDPEYTEVEVTSIEILAGDTHEVLHERINRAPWWSGGQPGRWLEELAEELLMGAAE